MRNGMKQVVQDLLNGQSLGVGMLPAIIAIIAAKLMPAVLTGDGF